MKKEEELTEEDLLVRAVKPKETEAPEEEEKETTSNKKSPPFYYTPVYFDSVGKLSTPTMLHFRNFSSNDAAKISLTEDKDEYKVFIECLNEMVWENFDCNELHIKELLKVLYTLHATYFSDQIEKKYYIDPDLDEPELSSDDNIDIAEIKIDNFKTNTLPKEFKEPITITSKVNDFKASFVLPRVGFILKAQNYLEEKYAKELADFYDIKRKIEEASSFKKAEKREEVYQKIPIESRLAYEKFQRKFAEEFMIVMNALCIKRVGSKTATTIKEHIELGKLIDRTMQMKFNKIQEDYDFGIDPEVEYFSVKQQKKLTRRFDFRLEDFLQAGDESGATERFDVQFGE